MTVEEFCKKYGYQYRQTEETQKTKYNHFYIELPNGFKENNILDAKDLSGLIAQFDKVVIGFDAEEEKHILDLANYKK